jgi:pyruvate dehydrogenase E1 component beta subunit
VNPREPVARVESGASALLSYREACRQALREALQRDPRCVLLGEDVGLYGGCYAVSKGLLEEFGPQRVVDTPLAEAALTGIAIGAAMAGLRPILEIMTCNFSLLALDQIVNNAATIPHMSGGQFTVPLVIRMATGGGRQLAAQHSHSLEGWYAHVPGLRILAPATVEDARHMLGAALRADHPVLIFEHVMLYASEAVPDPACTGVDLERAGIRRAGRDLTLVTYGNGLPKCLAAAEILAAQGIEAEVIDLRVLRPLDEATLVESVMRTRRCVIVDEGWRSGSLAAEIAARLAEAAFDQLDAPPRRLCGREVPMPYAAHLEQACLPQVGQIVAEARALARGDGRGSGVRAHRAAPPAEAPASAVSASASPPGASPPAATPGPAPTDAPGEAPATTDFVMPALGADMATGELVRWHVQPGDTVHRGDVVAVVETHKGAIDVEIFLDGVIDELAPLHVPLPVGARLARVHRAPVAAAPADVGTRPVTTPSAAAVVEPQPPAPAFQEPQPAATASGVTRPFDPAAMRAAIGVAMARAKREIPHYYLSEPVPLRRALDWLREHNERVPVTQRVLLAALLVKAVARALQQAPALNGHHVDGAFRPARPVHAGIAIWVRGGGLVAPALHDVQDRSVPQVMAALGDLVQRARAGSLRSSELTDPTITLTALGDEGAQAVYGVIYPPQVALVGFGRVRERAWVESGQVVPMHVIEASLAADHRVSDGREGSAFLAALAEQLQRPEAL